MARRSATRKCQFGARVAKAPNWLEFYHAALDIGKAPSCLAPERSGGAKQLTRLSFDGGAISSCPLASIRLGWLAAQL
jgi:hypothetical protein